MKNILLLTSLLLIAEILFAQQNLPYQTGFDNASEQAGWFEYRTGITSSFNWSIAGSGSVSPPNALHHDYPVGSASTDTTTDWYVSPGLNFNGSSKIKLKFNVYSITGSSTPVDEFGIWYSSTGADPSTNTFTQVAEFKNLASSSFTIIDTTDIQIPSVSGTGYIAIKYKATNNWFVITLDDIEIESEVSSAEIISYNIFQSPSAILISNTLSFKNPFKEFSEQIIISDLSGRIMNRYENVSAEELICYSGISSGIYLAQSFNDKGIKTMRIVVQ